MQPPNGSYLFPSASPLFPVYGLKAAAGSTPSNAPSQSSWLENTSFSGAIVTPLLQQSVARDAEIYLATSAPPLPKEAPPPLPPSLQPPPPPTPSSSSTIVKQSRPRAADFFDEPPPRPAPALYHAVQGMWQQEVKLTSIDTEDLSVPVIYHSSSSDEESSDEGEDSSSKNKGKRDKKHKDKKRKKKDKKKKKKDKTRRKSDKEKVLEKELQLAKAIEQRPSSSSWLEDVKGDVSTTFYLDVKGDRNNLVFSSIYRGDVPVYFRQRFCIGLAPDERITFNKGGYIVYKYDSDRTVSIARYCGAEQVRRLRIGGKINLNRTALSTRPPLSGSLNDNYLPLTVPGANEDEVMGEEDENQELSVEDELQERTREFNRMVREDPRDVSLWLQFISFQDECAKLGKKVGESSVVEKKIAIYEKALTYHPDSEELLLGYLDACQKVMEADKVKALWDRIIGQHTGRMKLWKGYIRYHEAEFSSFSVSVVRSAFQTALQMIAKHKTSLQGVEFAALERSLVNLFAQAATFERQAGYIERAVAIFQALIELNCFKAPNVKTPTAQLGSFERFWEAEAARIGENGAQGWAQWTIDVKQENAQAGTEKKKKRKRRAVQFPSVQTNVVIEPQEGPQAQPPRSEETGGERDTELYREWLALERKREMEGWLPLRERQRQRDEIVDDPDRVVAWEDVRDHLFVVQSDEVKLELIFTFLDFLGLRLPLRRLHTNDENFIDRLQDMEEVGQLFDNLTANSISWEGSASLSDPSKITFIRNVLTLAMRAFPTNVDLATTFISFEALHDVNKARKLAKELLKQNRNDLRLWNEYARGEARNAKVDEARRVYETALSLSRQMPAQSRKDALLLYRNYIEVIVDHVAEPSSLAIHVLVSATEDVYTPHQADVQMQPTRVVRSRKVYNDWLNAARETLTWEADFAHKMICFAYFEYFTLGIDAAENVSKLVLQTYARAQRDSSVEHEQLLVAFVKLLHWHAQKGPSPPGKLRRALEHALSLYPSNALFLSLYIRGEAKSQLENRLRRYFDEKCTSGSSIIVWLFAIRSEISRLGSGPRIRTLFERAAESLSTRDAVVLWRFYLDFEISMRDLELAKRVYFRAIRRVPWSKLIWTDAVAKLCSSFSRQELEELLQLMIDKELRVRTDPREIELLRLQQAGAPST